LIESYDGVRDLRCKIFWKKNQDFNHNFCFQRVNFSLQMANPKTTQPTDQKGNFVIAGEKAQEAANYTSEKLHTAGIYIADTAVTAKDMVVDAGAYVAATAVAAKDKVVSATHSVEHNTAEGMRAAADKIDPEIKSKI
jgi:hypothetical protein